VGYRLLRRQREDGSFEVSMTADLHEVVSHHVVFDSIVVPGVVFVEMALEATKKLFGHGVVRLKDVTMVFPFVCPDRLSVTEPAPVMRFVMKGDSRFQIESTSGSGKVTSHVEAALDRSPQDPSPPPVDLHGLQLRIDEPVNVSDVYKAIADVGLTLGSMFQVARQVWRKETETTCEVLAMLQFDGRKAPNIGYLCHPALMDGTIHILATASIGKDVSGVGLMIFGGVGRVTVVRQENFSRLDRYWAHLTITESLESSQTFDVRVMADDGSLLMLLDDVVFRSVKPAQIQM
ncbi:unnamed protein product, partial [Polarella glacialis]